MKTKYILYLLSLGILLWPQPDGYNQSNNVKYQTKPTTKKKVKLPPGPSVRDVTESTRPAIDSMKELYNTRNRIALLEKQVTDLKKELQDTVTNNAKKRKADLQAAKNVSARLKTLTLRNAQDSVDRATDSALKSSLDPTLIVLGRDTVPVYIHDTVPMSKRDFKRYIKRKKNG